MTLAFHNIYHSYTARTRDTSHKASIQNVSFDANPGEVLCLVGPSGCGKTTLLRLAAGLERIHKGEIWLDGICIDGPQQWIPPQERAVGYVFQDHVLFPHMTVAENIQYGLKPFSTSEKNHRLENWLSRLELTLLAKRYPHQLSGGQQQRVAIARAMAPGPKVVLMDEPFVSLDAHLRQQLQQDFRILLKNENIPAIFVTHDGDEALTMGDRLILMDQGQILEHGTAEVLFQQPSTARGALLFRGRTRLDGYIEDGMIKTEFGLIDNTAHQQSFKQHDVHLVISEADIEIHPQPDERSPIITVIDSRFSGPDWIIIVQSPSGTTLRIPNTVPIQPGTQVTCHIPNHALIHIESIKKGST